MKHTVISHCTPLLLLLMPALSACSSRPEVIVEPVTEDFEVEVRSNGVAVKDFEQKLVHHIDVSPAVVQALRETSKLTRRLPFSAKLQRDLSGAVSGVRLLPPPSGAASRLGLRPEDLLTAVGKSRITRLGDVALLFSALNKEQEATLTFLREGRPHKILYRVVE